MTITKEQIKERFDSLPKDIKEAISSVDTTNKIMDIAKKYDIQIDEISELVDEVGLVMLGFTHPNDFISNLKRRLGVGKELAEILSREINSEIFIKIKESLRQISERPATIIKPQPVLIPSEEYDREKILREVKNPLGEEKNDDIKNINEEVDIIKQKLTQSVKLPMVEEKKEIDLYREPIEE